MNCALDGHQLFYEEPSIRKVMFRRSAAQAVARAGHHSLFKAVVQKLQLKTKVRKAS